MLCPQGCVLSPFLFLLTMDFVMRRSLEHDIHGLRWGTGQLTDLDFADDVALLRKTQPGLVQMTSALEVEAAKVGLRISASKSKILRVGYTGPHMAITVGQQQLQEVEEFTYLGSVITADGGSDRDVTCRIGKAAAMFQRLQPIWTTRSIALHTKIRLFNTIVIPTALYACETWRFTATTAHRLNVFQQRCLRRILHISYRDHITNDEVHRRTDTHPVADMVTERRCRFAGHILRMDRTRIPKTAITWIPEGGKRKRGRPKQTWHRTFTTDLCAMNGTWEAAPTMAADRQQWRTLCAQCAERRRRL